jgi:hypothetical protein
VEKSCENIGRAYFLGGAMIRFATLLLTIPLVAGGGTPKGGWTFGVYGANPDLKGYYKDSGGNASPTDFVTDFDIKKDFNLKRDKTSMGLHVEYSGFKFGCAINYGVEDYAGSARIEREFEVSGITFTDGMDVDSSLKLTTFDVVGTWKAFNWSSAWVGFDLGVQMWYLDVKADGRHRDGLVPPVTVNETYNAPIPHIGASCGYWAFDDRLALGAKVHFLSYSGATYTRFAADARYYFLPWLGARVFFDTQSMDAPDGSLISNVELKLDHSNFGLGLVARW